MADTGRKETTERLSRLLEKHIDPKNDPRIYWAKEVTFDYSTEHPIRVDYMRFKPVNNSVSGIEKGDFYCYEIKSSVEDFNSKHGHNFIGEYNYYVMPAEVLAEVARYLPYWVGVFIPEGNGLYCAKKARLKTRTRPVSEMLLMMFRSSRREALKMGKMNSRAIDPPPNEPLTLEEL